MLSPKDLADLIKEQAKILGFDDAGIATVDDHLPFAKEFRRAFENGRFGPLDYLEKTLEARINLRSVFPEAKSVVVLVKNYYTGDHPTSDLVQAKIARYAWGQDYHQWFKKKLKQMRTFLMDKTQNQAKIWIYNDTGPFLERAWAHKAGLGFIGKSAMFIHRDLGTWTFLGGFATDLDLACDQAYVGPSCGSCTKCMDACPTGAIISPQTLDARKCISTWTIERTLHKDAIRLAPRDHQWGFGCDICQEVCPWNKFQQVSSEPRFQPQAGRVFLDAQTFKQDLRGSPLNRTRKAGLMANFLRIQNSLSQKNIRQIF